MATICNFFFNHQQFHDAVVAPGFHVKTPHWKAPTSGSPESRMTLYIFCMLEDETLSTCCRITFTECHWNGNRALKIFHVGFKIELRMAETPYALVITLVWKIRKKVQWQLFHSYIRSDKVVVRWGKKKRTKRMNYFQVLLSTATPVSGQGYKVDSSVSAFHRCGSLPLFDSFTSFFFVCKSLFSFTTPAKYSGLQSKRRTNFLQYFCSPCSPESPSTWRLLLPVLTVGRAPPQHRLPQDVWATLLASTRSSPGILPFPAATHLCVNCTSSHLA